MKRLKRSLSKATGSSKSKKQAPPPEPSDPSIYVPTIPDSCKAKYSKLVTLKHDPPRHLDLGDVCQLGIGDDLRFITENCGWEYLLATQTPDYDTLTCEFLSTFKFGGGIGDQTVKFRVMNTDYAMSKTEFGNLFHFPRTDEYTFDRDFDQRAFWRQLAFPGGAGSNWKPGDSKCKYILNLSFRVAHRIMSEILFPRHETSHLVLMGELFILWCITEGREPDSATLLLDHLKKVSNKTSGTLCVGGLITYITQTLGHDLTAYTPTLISVPITRKHLVRMKILTEEVRNVFRVAMPWDEHHGILWRSELTIRDRRCWREAIEGLRDEDSDEGDAGEPDDEDAAQDDDDLEPATEAGNSDTDMGDAGTPPRMSTAGASSSHAPRPSRRRPYTMAQLATDMHQMQMGQREFYRKAEERWAAQDLRIAQQDQRIAEQDRRYSVSEGMYGDLYRHTFGHFYDPNKPHYPRDPPPPFE